MKTLDIAKRLIDYGFHPPTIYFPLIVDEAMMIEPTETEGIEALDAFCDAMLAIDQRVDRQAGAGEGRAVQRAAAPPGRGDGGTQADPALAGLVGEQAPPSR